MGIGAKGAIGDTNQLPGEHALTQTKFGRELNTRGVRATYTLDRINTGRIAFALEGAHIQISHTIPVDELLDHLLKTNSGLKKPAKASRDAAATSTASSPHRHIVI